MGFPSPAQDYVEERISLLCNCSIKSSVSKTSPLFLQRSSDYANAVIESDSPARAQLVRVDEQADVQVGSGR